MTPTPRFQLHLRLKIAAWAAILAWVFLGVLFLGIVPYKLGVFTSELTTATPILLFGGLAFSSIYVILALTLRCPSCEKHFLVERRGQKHSSARKISIISYWATTVLDVIRKNRFTCMYCGTQFDLKERHNIE
jgi:hypothetical protein